MYGYPSRTRTIWVSLRVVIEMDEFYDNPYVAPRREFNARIVNDKGYENYHAGVTEEELRKLIDDAGIDLRRHEFYGVESRQIDYNYF